MKRIALLLIANLMGFICLAQTIDNVKVGMGVSFLGTGDIWAAKFEGEVTKNYNSIISGSVLLGLGRGGNGIYQQTFTTNLDGNVFVSPFGNDKAYNFKIGSGLSLMYVSDSYPGDLWFVPSDRRVSLGANIIMEHEVLIHKKYLLGLKGIIQPST